MLDPVIKALVATTDGLPLLCYSFDTTWQVVMRERAARHHIKVYIKEAFLDGSVGENSKNITWRVQA